MAESAMARLMLESALRDALVFDKLVHDDEVHDSMLGFHAQQAVEKAIKAVLFQRGVLVPRTHDVVVLLDLMDAEAIEPPPHALHLDELNPFAVHARYGALDVGPLDRPTVATWMHDVLAWARDASS